MKERKEDDEVATEQEEKEEMRAKDTKRPGGWICLCAC